MFRHRPFTLSCRHRPATCCHRVNLSLTESAELPKWECSGTGVGPAVARMSRRRNARRPFSLAQSPPSVCQTPRSITLFKLSERSTRSCARYRRAQSFAQDLVSLSQNESGRWRHRPLHRYFRISSRRRDKLAMQREESWHCQRSTKRATSVPELRPDRR